MIVPGSDTIGTAAMALSVLFKLGFVILLIYVSLFLLKRWQTGKLPGSVKKLSILETTHLSPRQALHLVQVGGQVFLVGATDQTISYLVKVDEIKPCEGVRTPFAPTASLETFDRFNEAKLNDLEDPHKDGEHLLPGSLKSLPSFTSILANAFGRR